MTISPIMRQHLADREERRVSGYKLGAKRSAEKTRKEYRAKCLALAGVTNLENLTPRQRKYAVEKGHKIRQQQVQAVKAVRKRVHTERLRLAMPAWADTKAMQRIYAEAARITRETGKPHEVDHVIPLLGETVSGLHVEYNLQILPRSANRRKCNKLLAA